MPPSVQPAARARRLAPALLFVCLWSTGFIGAKLGLPHAEALTFLTLRFVAAALVLAAVALVTRAAWPQTGAAWRHMIVAGTLIQAVYLGGVYVGIGLGVEAGLASLIVSLQPLLVAALAGPLLDERVSLRQWLGLALGLGGVVLVLAEKLGAGPGALLGGLACVIALLAITSGTLYQKRFGAGVDLFAGTTVQYAVAAALCAVPAVAFESNRVDWAPEFVLAFAWLVGLSTSALPLFYVLIREGGAAAVSSLFFLVPPITALMAWAIFGERLSTAALAGLVVTAIGVALATAVRQG